MKRAKKAIRIRRRRGRATVPITLRAEILAGATQIGTAEVCLALPTEVGQVLGPWIFSQVEAWTKKPIASGPLPKVNAPGSGWTS